MFVTIIGFPAALALLVAADILGRVGSTIVFLSVADSLVGHDDGWIIPLVIAGEISGGLALTGVG